MSRATCRGTLGWYQEAVAIWAWSIAIAVTRELRLAARRAAVAAAVDLRCLPLEVAASLPPDDEEM